MKGMVKFPFPGVPNIPNLDMLEKLLRFSEQGKKYEDLKMKKETIDALWSEYRRFVEESEYDKAIEILKMITSIASNS